jgi:Flp pilus assembly protein TadB
MAVGYEHKLAEARDHEAEALSRQHQVAHEREHEANQEAIQSATAALRSELGTLQTDLDRLRDQANTFMTVDRFDREHENLKKGQGEDHVALTTLIAQLGTLRGIVALLGVPGLVALAWAVIAAATGHALTGPSGLIP